MTATGATFFAILAGAMFTPVFLPWIPGRQFWWKGMIAGCLAGSIYVSLIMKNAILLESASMWILIVATASYMAMNFTGIALKAYLEKVPLV